jgi:hypothetical protein
MFVPHSGKHGSGRSSYVGFNPVFEPQPLSLEDQSLLENVRIYCADDGERGQQAWLVIQSTSNLIESLNRIRRNLPQNDYAQPLLSSVYCQMGYEYQENRSIVVYSLAPESPYNGLTSLWSTRLIERLIRNDDTELLSNLFRATGWADMDTRVDLGGFFVRELQREPEAFLFRLKDQPGSVRGDVYRVIYPAFENSVDSGARLRLHVMNQTAGTPSALVALEMFDALKRARSSADDMGASISKN